MKLSTNWIENDGRSPGLMLAHAHGWGTILDVELRDGTVELEMPAWCYEFALSGAPKDVLRYRINVEWDQATIDKAAMELAKPVVDFIKHNNIDMTKHTLDEVIEGYFSAQRKCEQVIAKQVRAYLEAGR